MLPSFVVLGFSFALLFLLVFFLASLALVFVFLVFWKEGGFCVKKKNKNENTNAFY